MALEPERTRAYFRYLIHKGSIERYGIPYTVWEDRKARVERELEVIESAGFSGYFVILASIMDFCREAHIPYGPGRGSVGGSYALYLAGIHEVDSIEHGLIFERFLTADRVSYPDVDIDVSQERRGEVIDFVRRTYGKAGMAVIQVGAFQRSGGRGTINNMVAAMRETDPNADAIGYNLRECLPAKGSITGGQKKEKELEWWLENGHGDRDKFRQIAEDAGWLDRMLAIDGAYTGLTRHAAGVLLLSESDLRRMPQSSTDGQNMVSGFDMYSLDELGYLKYDLLGLRTMDVISEAHKFSGGSGDTRDLLAIWEQHRDDPEPYELLQNADSLGIFQMETDGYRRTLKDFQPNCFNHIVHLNALYRPGALDYVRESDGMNMVEIFIERRHNREASLPPAKELQDLLEESHGVFLYQEQAMKAVQILAGFDGKQADRLRKGIGKKQADVIESLKADYYAGCDENNIEIAVATRVWENIEAAARYSWNKAHAVEYAIITWLTMWFKFHHPAAFYSALFNSYEGEADKLSGALAEARQRVEIRPPDINIAQEGFVPDGDAIVFGFSGVKGMGDSNRQKILVERLIGGEFPSYEEFCKRIPSLPISMKTSLIKCGAFDKIDDRAVLLGTCIKPGKGSKCKECQGEGHVLVAQGTSICMHCNGIGFIPKDWTVAEQLNHNRNLKKPRPMAPLWEITMPSDDQLSEGELESIGYYISVAPLEEVTTALSRLGDGHFGGKIDKIYHKVDKNGDDYADLVLTTPALTKQRVRIFASNWPLMQAWIKQGQSIIVRGVMQGETILGNNCFLASDVRHFRKIITKRNDIQSSEPFDGTIETVEALEKAGYEVTLV